MAYYPWLVNRVILVEASYPWLRPVIPVWTAFIIPGSAWLSLVGHFGSLPG